MTSPRSSHHLAPTAICATSLLLIAACATATTPDAPHTVDPEAIRAVAAQGSAGELDPRVVPTHVALTLRLDPAASGYTGRATITIDLLEDTPRLRLHACANIRLTDARIDAQPAQHAHVPGGHCLLELTAPQPLAPGTHHLTLDFEAAWWHELRAFYRIVVDGQPFVVSQMGSGALRTAIPAFDEPLFKTPLALAIEAPHDLVALANGALKLSQPIAPDDPLALPPFPGDPNPAADSPFVRHHFRTTPPIPGYVVAATVGPWELHPAPGPATVPIRIAVPRGADGWQFALEQTPRILAAAEAFFDDPYPFDKLDLVAVSELGPLAMENPGLVTVRATALLLDAEADRDAHRNVAWIIAHELAHIWLGDLVTMAWWDDLWLSEALATWLGSSLTDALEPAWEQHARDLIDRHAMIARDVWPTRAIRAPVAPQSDQIEAAFSLMTYFKGARIMDGLEHWLGPEVWREGLRRYVQAHRWRSARTADFLAVFHDLGAPPSLERVLLGLLGDEGVSHLALTTACDAGRLTIAANIERHRPLGASSLAPASPRGPLAACLRLGFEDGSTSQHCVVLEAPSEGFDLALPAGRCPVFVHPMAGEQGYYRWSLAAPDLQALLAHLSALDDGELGALPDQLWGAFESGRLEVEALLAALETLSQVPRLPPLAILGTAQVLLQLDTLPAAHAAGLPRRTVAILDALDARLPREPAPGSLSEEALDHLHLARVEVADELGAAQAWLAEARAVLEGRSSSWHAFTLGVAAAQPGFLTELADYGPCSGWFGAIAARARGASALEALHLMEDCATTSRSYLETLATAPDAARAVYDALTSGPGLLAGDAARQAEIVAWAAVALCTDPSSTRQRLLEVGADPDGHALALPLERAARCHALEQAQRR